VISQTQRLLPDNTKTQNTHKTKTAMPPAEFEPAPRKQAAADPCLRPRGHRDLHRVSNSMPK